MFRGLMLIIGNPTQHPKVMSLLADEHAAFPPFPDRYKFFKQSKHALCFHNMLKACLPVAVFIA